LYSDASQWLDCASTGHQLFKENFDFITNAHTLHEDLSEALERKRNVSASNDGEVTLDEQLFLYHSWKHHELFSRIVQLKDEHKKE
jgi:predicted transcriptional regulator